jgi:hypothetical protein
MKNIFNIFAKILFYIMFKTRYFFFYNLFKNTAIIILFLPYPQSTHAQEHHNPTFGAEIKTHYAFLMSHHNHMRILTEQHFPIYQLNLFKYGNHGKEWQKLYNYPQYGLSIIYSPLSSPNYMGYGFGIVPFLNFPMYQNNRFSANFFVGSGIGFIEKPFHITENYKNEAIGSRLNAVLMGQTDLRYRISQNADISAGISITHFSNGKARTPNLGINNVGIFAGYAHHFPVKKEIKSIKSTEEDKLWENNFFFSASMKQIYPVGGKNYLYTAYSLNTKRILNKKRKIGAGIDVFYDYSDRAHFKNKGFDNPDITYIKPAIYALHDYRLGKMSIFIHIGTYLYAFDKNQHVGMIYDRVGIQYYFNDLISSLIALKTHYATADCIEMSINLSF